MITYNSRALKTLLNNSFKCRKMATASTNRPILYGDEASPPFRFVKITAKLLGVDLQIHYVDLFKGEHKTEFYSKINPLQKVPALSIEGHTVCDSHAIALYLCRQAETQDLYPADNILRTKVDEILFFNATTLFPLDHTILSECFAGKWPADENKVSQWYSALDHIEMLLNKNEWLSGSKMLLCDICCAMTISSVGVLFPPLDRHSKVKQWMTKMDNLPYFDINRKGLERLRVFLKEYNPALVHCL